MSNNIFYTHLYQLLIFVPTYNVFNIISNGNYYKRWEKININSRYYTMGVHLYRSTMVIRNENDGNYIHFQRNLYYCSTIVIASLCIYKYFEQPVLGLFILRYLINVYNKNNVLRRELSSQFLKMYYLIIIICSLII